MTWIIGAVAPYSCVIGISDIQVTFAGTRTKDCLQKLHYIDPYIACGFAGSVELGFMMLQDLLDFLKLNLSKRGIAWKPDWVAGVWHKRAQTIFGNARDELRKSGCELMLLGVHPHENSKGPPGWDAVPYIVIMKPPEFTPTCYKEPWEYCSIGSGSSRYAKVIENIKNQQLDPLMISVDEKGDKEIAPNLPFFLIAEAISENPAFGVSRHLQALIIQNGKVEPLNNYERRTDKDGKEQLIGIPPVASNWEEFQKICADENLDNTKAIC